MDMIEAKKRFDAFTKAYPECSDWSMKSYLEHEAILKPNNAGITINSGNNSSTNMRTNINQSTPSSLTSQFSESEINARAMDLYGKMQDRLDFFSRVKTVDEDDIKAMTKLVSFGSQPIDLVKNKEICNKLYMEAEKYWKRYTTDVKALIMTHINDLKKKKMDAALIDNDYIVFAMDIILANRRTIAIKPLPIDYDIFKNVLEEQGIYKQNGEDTFVPNSVSKIPESSEKESQYKSIYDIKDKTDALLEKSNSQERSDYSNKSKKTDASSFDSNSDELIRKKKKSLEKNQKIQKRQEEEKKEYNDAEEEMEKEEEEIILVTNNKPIDNKRKRIFTVDKKYNEEDESQSKKFSKKNQNNMIKTVMKEKKQQNQKKTCRVMRNVQQEVYDLKRTNTRKKDD